MTARSLATGINPTNRGLCWTGHPLLDTIDSESPTRIELQAWVAEHDKIEIETEIFDAGEFRRLKGFTKGTSPPPFPHNAGIVILISPRSTAAAQRNLSPADTDLIEITLTTIYA